MTIGFSTSAAASLTGSSGGSGAYYRFRPAGSPPRPPIGEPDGAVFVLFSMVKFMLWCLLLVVCWPLALLALILYPLVWLLLIPFRVLGIAVEGVLGLVRGIVMLPLRVLAGPRGY